MPRSVASRIHKKVTVAGEDSDTGGGDTDLEETPKPAHRTLSKRRVSDVYDASFTSESGRPPLKSVNINDDAAEKRRRRKSAKNVPIDEAGPNTDDARAAAHARQRQQLLSIDQPPTANVPLDVMNSNFEEWMKMATDNKINAANSWNFALIDYFHDMSLLRNNTDNSINFQRASCTLDGCVKIWTSRVDSVGTETGKLLSNLANEGRDDGDEDLDNPDGHEPSQARKRKATRAESTLAKSIAQLRNKKLDLEFRVDPLFRKTCADFDEGGAHGLLMNHLSLGVGTDGTLRVVFDASDSMGRGEEEEESLEDPPDAIDLSYLRDNFMPSLTVLDDKAISHSLEGFSFARDTFSFDDTTFGRTSPTRDFDEEDQQPFETDPGQLDGAMDVDIDEPVEDFFVGDQAVGDDFVDDGPGSPSGAGAGEDGSMDPETSREPNRQGTFVPFDPRRAPNEKDLIMAMTDSDKDGSGMMMDYFDQSFLKNWAGPEHWKLRKIVRKPDAPDNSAAKPRRERKEPFKIDFLSPPEKDVKERAKELFAPVTRGAGINLPGPAYGKAAVKKGPKGKKSKEAEKSKRNDQTLPDDMHFSSRQLVTLFLKPKFSLRMRGHRVRLDDRPDGEVDENFWAQAAADQAAGRAADEGDETANGGAIPFNTQFFHDDFDEGPGFDDDGEADLPSMAEPGEQDLLAATQGQTRRAKPQTVNYAKKAKRVDVRKLKENIWKGLDIVVPDANKDDDVDMDVETPLPTDPAEARVFESVISGLQKSYPKDKMDEISTSFCFICLLHLANERGLKLEAGADAANEDRNVVGNIWDLKIYRDPNATPAA